MEPMKKNPIEARESWRLHVKRSKESEENRRMLKHDSLSERENDLEALVDLEKKMEEKRLKKQAKKQAEQVAKVKKKHRKRVKQLRHHSGISKTTVHGLMVSERVNTACAALIYYSIRHEPKYQ
jgi:hypothetical protein